ncbi:sensor histidine kinase [Corynebacterium urinipleomorphum]|uniref:sensor histidine kinase n=1 Tax=Corynebacterium urinipleomorphum TaxID=1852380 RepID=UPI000B359209|nr:histidine kinase [Corynebacterium urinipleomorphum]
MATLRQWIEGFPEAPAPRRWFLAGTSIVVCAVALVVVLLLGAGHGDGLAFAFHLVVVLGALSALLCPVPAAATMGVLLQLSATYPELQSPIMVFGVLTTVVLVALRSAPAVSAVCAVALWYLALTSVTSKDFFPDDGETAAILGALLLAGWAGALVLRETLIKRRQESTQFTRRLEDERERTVKALHGSVAASLTSVVLRSESMAMKAEDSSREESLLIAEDARRAMREVRELIHYMRTDSESAFESSAMREPYTLYENLTTITGKLRSHGFTVVDSGVNEETLSCIQLAHGYTVFRELKTNILKYADRSKPVIVAVVNEDDTLTVAIQNTIAGGEPGVHMTTEIGLKDAAELVESDGGALSFTSDGTTWRCELAFPSRAHS